MQQTLRSSSQMMTRLCTLIVTLFSAASAQAQQTFSVDRLTDAGEGDGLVGDLRYCITNAIDGDTITFTVTGTINLTTVLPDLTRSINIEGPGSKLLTVQRSTGGEYRIFTNRAVVSISGLTITGGTSGQVETGCLRPGALGGGVYNSGTLTLNDCVISDSRVGDLRATFGGCGGGVYNSGTMAINNATILRNHAGREFGDGYGGGIYNAGVLTVSNSTISGNLAGPNTYRFTSGEGGGVFSTGMVTIENSTISGNSAQTYCIEFCGFARGGAISATAVTLRNSTVSNNTAGEEGSCGGIAWANNLDMRNTILANNRADNGGNDLCGNITASGYNLIGDPRGGTGFDKTDLLNVNPILGPLQDNGGPTFTHALLPGSPAIDAGDPDFIGPLGFDQRGEGFPRIVNGIVDIGAFEVQAQ